MPLSLHLFFIATEDTPISFATEVAGLTQIKAFNSSSEGQSTYLTEVCKSFSRSPTTLQPEYSTV